MLPSVAIVYSASLGTVRRIVIPDAEDQLADPAHQAGQGELRIVVPRERYDQLGAQALVNEVTGRNPNPGIDDRYAIVDPNGKVIGAILFDPTCGPVEGVPPPGHQLIQHPDATQGWSFRAGRFIVPRKA